MGKPNPNPNDATVLLSTCLGFSPSWNEMICVSSLAFSVDIIAPTTESQGMPRKVSLAAAPISVSSA
jgi:hypothetical protein